MSERMNILIACEESQAVCIEMRKLGHRAFSCDIIECSGGHPEWHIQGDVLPLLNGRCSFRTMDGKEHKVDGKWDMIIAHPPCTYLSLAGNRWYNVEKHTEKPEMAYHTWIDANGVKKRQVMWYYNTRCLPHADRAKAASRTFPGIAKAFAEQWARRANDE